MKNKKAFTLVELIVVIVILAALIAIGVMSYVGAQASSRDAKRKSDVNTFVTAMTMYKVDKKTFAFSAATNAGNATGEGFVNKTYGASPKVSMIKYLTDNGYLNGKLEDPKYDDTQCGDPDDLSLCRDYVYMHNTGSGGVGTIYAKLENVKYGGDNDMSNNTTCTGCADFSADLRTYYSFVKIIK